MNEQMMVQMMQKMAQMLAASQKDKKADKQTLQLMEKFMKNQNDLNASEMRKLMRENRSLFRKRSRSKSRDRRSPSRERRRRERRERSRERKARENNQRSVEMVSQPCKFYQEGDCKKGNNCNFLHEMPTSNQKKRDICKFYLQGFCGKGDHCNFMHEEFPCKFFHTGADCYSGEKCRFSHQPLTEETRGLLRNYLDSGELPDDHLRKKEILPPTTSYPPNKPSVKRHAVLGDVSEEIKKSYETWSWQKEMKELELAYTGNKRNLFEIEDEFVVTEKPPSPPPSEEPQADMEDPDERECKIMSYYIDTMGDVDCRVLPPPETVLPVTQANLIPEEEEDELLLFSAHDEDLRMFPPAQSSQDSQEEQLIQASSVTDQPLWNQDTVIPDQPDQVQTPLVAPKLEDEVGAGDSKPKYDIAKMLNVIRQTSSQMAPSTAVPQQQSEFWQNIFSGARLSSPVHRSPQKDQSRDPRLKSGKDRSDRHPSISSPRKGSDPSSRESGSESESSSDYKLVPVKTPDVDYSCLVHLYRSDSKLKNDPRLQKFFNKIPTSVVDHLSKILPATPCSKSNTSSRNTLASLMTTLPTKSNSKTPLTPDGQILPLLPPLTLTEPKTSTLPIPPPPPIMSPFELMTSSPKIKIANGTRDHVEKLMESAMDLSNQMHEHIEIKKENEEPKNFIAETRTESPNLDIALTMSSDTPASPSSRRSSCDVNSPPQVASEDVKREEDLQKGVFNSIDPSPV